MTLRHIFLHAGYTALALALFLLVTVEFCLAADISQDNILLLTSLHDLSFTWLPAFILLMGSTCFMLHYGLDLLRPSKGSDGPRPGL